MAVDPPPRDAPTLPPDPGPTTLSPAAPTLPPAGVPACIGRYRVERKLGEGGMGTVYLAHDPQLDRPVALKVPRGQAADARFLREARAAAALRHPNICPIYDLGDADGVRYLCLAYVRGEPLS